MWFWSTLYVRMYMGVSYWLKVYQVRIDWQSFRIWFKSIIKMAVTYTRQSSRLSSGLFYLNLICYPHFINGAPRCREFSFHAQESGS